MRQSIASQEYISTITLNKYAAEINESIVEAFSDYILPHRNESKKHYLKSEVRLYVPKRKYIFSTPTRHIEPCEVNKGDYSYESTLQKLFWTDDEKKKLIFLSGTIGCGKSTLLDYFLRCHCPENSDSESFSKKLIIHIDFKGVSSSEHFFRRFLEEISLSLKTNQIYDIFAEILEKDSDKYDRVFKVLRLLSSSIKEGTINFSYLIICFDNIDQSPPEIQKEAISIAQDIIEKRNSINVFKIFFPLWPQTIMSYRLKNLLRINDSEFITIELSHPDLKLLTLKRVRKLFNLINKDSRLEVRRFIKTINHKIDKNHKSFLSNIAYGNIKFMGLLFSEVVKSRSISKYQKLYKDIRDYQFFDSLICGSNPTHNSLESYILNPYLNVSTPNLPTESLVTCYLLQYFHLQKYDFKETLKYFSDIGFTKGLTTDALERLDERHVIHFDYYSNGERQINVHQKVRKSYLHLMVEPAALDNWAQTTPLDEKFLKNRVPTVGYEDSDFKNRVENTISFISFLKQEETNLTDSFTPEQLQTLRENIPSLVEVAKDSYLDRLKALSSRGLPYSPHVTQNWWHKTIKELESI